MSQTTLAIPSNAGRVPVAPRIAHWVLQAAHRLGFVALLTMLAVWALYYKGSKIDGALAATAVASDLGLCCAMAAKLIARRYPAQRREGTGVVIFNLVIFVLSLNLMVYARMPVIRQSVGAFFSPSQPTPH